MLHVFFLIYFVLQQTTVQTRNQQTTAASVICHLWAVAGL